MGRVVLVGGSGFVGTALSERFIQAGHHVIVLDLVAPSQHLSERVDYIPIDIRECACRDAVNDAEHVFILAALLGKRCHEQPRVAWDTNVIGTINIINSLQYLQKKPALYFMSSANVYRIGTNSLPIQESGDVYPNNLYAAGKLIIENALVAAGLAFGLRSARLRPFTIYGPGPAAGSKGHFIANWLEKLRQGVPLTIYGDGHQTTDLVHVSDVANLCCQMIDRDIASPESPVFNVGCGVETSILQIARWFQDAAQDARFAFEPVSRPTPQRSFADIGRARKLLHYHPGISPELGIKALLG